MVNPASDIIGNGAIRLSPKLVTSLFSAESSDADHSDLGESKLLGSGTKTDVEGNAIKEDLRHAFFLAGPQRDIFSGDTKTNVRLSGPCIVVEINCYPNYGVL